MVGNKQTMEHNITFFEACEFLSKSRKSVSRYIRLGLLHPEEGRSKQGTLQYRFTMADLKAFKVRAGEDVEAPVKIDPPASVAENLGKTEPPETSQEGFVPFLMEQIKVKDEQIKIRDTQITEMIERSRETNILLNRSNERILELETKK